MIRLPMVGLYLFSSFAAVACACDLSTTPLTSEKYCVKYEAEDRKLNESYKNLMLSLNKSQKNTLKDVQRDWIKWRDEKCAEVQEGSGCSTGSCDGVAHDMCIIDLTKKRNMELMVFKKQKQEALKSGFVYLTVR